MHFLIRNRSMTLLKNTLYLCSLATILTSCGGSSSDSDVQHVSLQNRVSEKTINSLHVIEPPKDTFYFGFDRRNTAQEYAAQYLPFLEYLSQATGYHFKLHFTPQGTKLVDELGNNTVQFAAIGAMGFIEARALYDVSPLVRGLNEQDKAEYQSFVVVAPESKLRALAEIKGHRLALGNRNSTQGDLIPRVLIKEQGLSLSDFSSVRYTGSHANCAETILAGEADVCGMQDALATTYAEKGLLRILHKSAFFPSSGISVNKHVTEEVINNVKAALLNFKPLGKDAGALYNWDKTEMPHGFTVATNKDYSELEKWAVTFGFINLGAQ